MTIVFPMAGLSSRFLNAGYELPKYMLKVRDTSVFYNAVLGFKHYFKDCNFLFIYRNIYDTKNFIFNECEKLKIENKIFVELNNETQGQAHTVMLGLEKAQVNNNESIIIFNIDTFRYNYSLPNFNFDQLDGYLEVFRAEGEQWSFILPGKNNSVLKTAEKEKISEFCSSGLYYFKRCKDFKESFNFSYQNNLFVKNELYIAPLYNYLIQNNKTIKYYEITLDDVIFCGTPQEYEEINMIRNKCPITNSKNIEILSSRKFPLFCGCIIGNSENDLIYEEEFAICKDSGILFLNKLIPLNILYKNGHYAGSVGKIWEEHHETFAKFISQINPKNILEIGGGHGRLAQNFLKLQKANWTIVEPDTKTKFDNVNYIDGFFDKNICKDKHYDTIVHSHTFEHIYNPNDFLSDISTSLHEGGYMIFSLPNMQKWLENRFSNCLNFEHTLFLDENLIEHLLYKNRFQILVKKYFKDHSVFYLTKRDKNQKEIELKNNYKKNKKLFLDIREYYKTEVQKLNRLIEETSKNVYLFGAHLFSQNLIYDGLNISKIKYILDNDSNKQEKRLYGTSLYVKSPQILKNDDNALVILNAGVYSEEIKKDILTNINSKICIIML